MNTNNANAIHGENFEKKSANSVPAKYPISGMPPWNTPKSTAISSAFGEKRAQCCSPGRTTQLVASPFETETAKQSIAKPIAISMIERISTEKCTNYDLRMNTKNYVNYANTPKGGIIVWFCSGRQFCPWRYCRVCSCRTGGGWARYGR